MKITRVKSQVVKLPADEPLAGGPGFYRPFFEFVILGLETDAGIEGIGVTFFGWALTATLKHAVDQLSELVIGEDPCQRRAVADFSSRAHC
jgi:L-alanine-DL-glutamate epimerase-like enolase superfamily enzyme